MGRCLFIDILDNHIWLHKELDPADKLLLSATGSALLLKRMQDVDKRSFTQRALRKQRTQPLDSDH